MSTESIKFPELNINKQDKEKFNNLLPFFLDFVSYRIESNDLSVKVDDEKYDKMIRFLQGRPEEEIEELARDYISINSDNPVGQSLNLPQLLEKLYRFGIIPEEEIKKEKNKIKKSKPEKPPIYGYDPSGDHIAGVKTPSRGEVLSSIVIDNIEKKNKSAKLAGKEGADLLRDLAIKGIKKREDDQEDLEVIESGSSDKLLERLSDQGKSFEDYIREVKEKDGIDKEDKEMLEGPLTIKGLIKRFKKSKPNN